MKRALAIAVLTVFGAGAIASANIESKKFTVPPGSGKGAAECRGDKRPIAGGFALDQKIEELYPQSSYPAGKKWKVEAYNRNAPTLEGTAYALCLDEPKLFVRSKRVTQTVSGEIQATAKCPSGSQAVNGGGMGPGFNTVMRGSFPPGDERTWGVRWDYVSEGDRVKAYAVCDPSPGGTKMVEDSAISDPPRRRGDAEVTAQAECKAGRKLVGGGFFSTQTETNYLESRPVADSWRVRAKAAEGVTVIAFAVCQK